MLNIRGTRRSTVSNLNSQDLDDQYEIQITVSDFYGTLQPHHYSNRPLGITRRRCGTLKPVQKGREQTAHGPTWHPAYLHLPVPCFLC